MEYNIDSNIQPNQEGADITHQDLLDKLPEPQGQSPLFNKLPAEIRQVIFAYALTDYPDTAPAKLYGEWTLYSRPAYTAPCRSDTELLLTCRAIYQECWFMPFALCEQKHWLTALDRSPQDYKLWAANVRLRHVLDRLSASRQDPTIDLSHMRFFAQMYKLEQGEMGKFLGTLPDTLHIRTITLTIRHTDWWFWEEDQPLRLEGEWVPHIFEHLSPSLREFRIELESLERKRDQVQAIADQMMDKWYFRRRDGELLFADHTEESRWTGASRWQGKTWTRDESRPNEIDYYILTVSFKREAVVERNGSTISERARNHSIMDRMCACKWKLHMESPESDVSSEEDKDSDGEHFPVEGFLTE